MDEELGQALEESELIPEQEAETSQTDEQEIDAIDEFDEVEYEGKKYSLPKELKDALLRQSDYTRKTQEVAEQRKSIESQQAQIKQAYEVQQRNIQEYSQLIGIDQQIKRYENVDWNAFSDQDPVEAQKAWFQYQQLQQSRNGLANQISQRENQRQVEAQQMSARQIEEGQKVLQREIKGWSPDMAKEIRSYMISQGASDHDLDGIISPVAVKTMHKAYLYDQMMSKAKQKPAEETKPTPVTKVGQKAASTKDPDKMSTDEWMKWRESQLRKRA